MAVYHKVFAVLQKNSIISQPARTGGGGGGGFVVAFTCLGVDKKNMEVRRSLGAGGEVGVVARTSG